MVWTTLEDTKKKEALMAIFYVVIEHATKLEDDKI